MAAPGGVPVRSCARVVGSADSQKLDNGSIFIAGNAMELVPSGKSDGEKHTFSRIFDVHASDKDVYESEVLPLIGGMASATGSAACDQKVRPARDHSERRSMCAIPADDKNTDRRNHNQRNR